MGDLASEEALSDVITDYFVARPMEKGDGIDYSESESEEEMESAVSSGQLRADTPPSQSVSTQPTVPATSEEDLDSDDELFSPLENLLEKVSPPSAFPDERDETRECWCQLFDGKPCYTRYTAQELQSVRLEHSELTREEKDICIKSKLSCGMHLSNYTTRSRQKTQTERKSQRTDYYFHGDRVCKKIFAYMHGVGREKIDKLIKHYIVEGVSARVHGLTKHRPKHALSFEDTTRIVSFIVNYAELNAISLPGRTPHHWRSDVRLLPTNCTKKLVYDGYVESCRASQVRAVALRTFRRIWQELLPFITPMRPATDLCWVCQKGAMRVVRASDNKDGDTEKRAAYAAITEHLDIVTKERSVYTTVLQDAKCSLPEGAALGPHPASSSDHTSHYSFDFAQQVHYPSNPLQPGPIYFKTPRKCGLFGVCCEALSSQVNFLLDEACDVGKGANCVVSLLHYFFENYGLGEERVHLHADNCSGQNKNSCMMMYLMWRVLTGRHKSITLSFMITGHTKFSCDWCFGLVKRLYRRTKVDCLDDIASVVAKSAKGNITQLCGNEKGELYTQFYDWTSFLKQYFRKVKQIKKFHHFEFSAGSGVLRLREFSDSDPVEQKLLLSVSPDRDEMPLPINPRELDAKRQWYLYEEIRQFVADWCQDRVAPHPIIPKPGRTTTSEHSDSEEESPSRPPPPKTSRGKGKQGLKPGTKRGGKKGGK